MSEQMFEFQSQIPTENNNYTYGWGVRAEGDEAGYWMYVKGISFENEPFERWRFSSLADVKLYDTHQDKFLARYKGISEVTQVVREMAWRKQKNPCQLRF